MAFDIKTGAGKAQEIYDSKQKGLNKEDIMPINIEQQEQISPNVQVVTKK